MAVRSQELQNGKVAEAEKPRPSNNRPLNRFIAVFAWLVGAAATWLGLTSFLPGAPWWMPLVVAVATQGFLTVAQRAIWRGHPSMVSFAALLIDVALNAGGIFPYAQRVGETPTAKMIITTFGGSGQVGAITAMIVAVGLGFLIAAAPEELWNRRD